MSADIIEKDDLNIISTKDGRKVNAGEVAGRLLQDYWSSLGQIKFPIDPVELARGLGIQTFMAALDSDVDAVMWKRRGEDAEIHLNKNHDINPLRWACTHMIAHFILLRYADMDQGLDFGWIDRKGALEATQGVEGEVNVLAAEILMPSSVLKMLNGSGERRVSEFFGCPVSVAAQRLEQLRG